MKDRFLIYLAAMNLGIALINIIDFWVRRQWFLLAVSPGNIASAVYCFWCYWRVKKREAMSDKLIQSMDRLIAARTQSQIESALEQAEAVDREFEKHYLK